eukprot:1157479-Pelagomonas_calceolata.AAC.2
MEPYLRCHGYPLDAVKLAIQTVSGLISGAILSLPVRVGLVSTDLSGACMSACQHSFACHSLLLLFLLRRLATHFKALSNPLPEICDIPTYVQVRTLPETKHSRTQKFNALYKVEKFQFSINKKGAMSLAYMPPACENHPSSNPAKRKRETEEASVSPVPEGERRRRRWARRGRSSWVVGGCRRQTVSSVGKFA